ncbi:MAG: HPr family phosphocarrier protein [Gammaproteobacteria bacterium]|jgi:phosphocarrier protein HPr
MLHKEIEIINKLGMHARAAAKFVTLAQTFVSDIRIARNGREVNGKSIMGVMMLAAARGSTIELKVNGDDEEKAMEYLEQLIKNRFDEQE